MSVDRLVRDGGTPEFARPLHVGSPNLPDRATLFRLVEGILDRGRLTNFGPLVTAFEERVADVCGFRHAVATCNATIGLEIATRALGFRDEAVVPAWTFVATAHALRWQEIRPTFADVVAETHHLDARSVEQVLTPRTSGIVAVHLWGSRVDLRELRALADRHGLPIVVDAAHAFATRGTTPGTRMRGDAEVLSFHATKFLGAAEGGAVLTDDPDLAHRVRRMTNFGFSGRDQTDALGINGKLSELHAAMGLAGLEQLPRVLSANAANLDAYRQGLDQLPGLRLLEPNSTSHNNQYVVVEVDEAETGASRDALVRALQDEHVDARRYFTPGVHRLAPYAQEQPCAGLVLPVTERLARTTMVLPTGTSLQPPHVGRITSLLGRLLDRPEKSRRAPVVELRRVAA